MQKLLGIKELSEGIGIKPQTIRNRLSKGTFPIPAIKVCGRVKFKLKEIEKYLSNLKPYYKTKVDSGLPNGDNLT